MLKLFRGWMMVVSVSVLSPCIYGQGFVDEHPNLDQAIQDYLDEEQRCDQAAGSILLVNRVDVGRLRDVGFVDAGVGAAPQEHTEVIGTGIVAAYRCLLATLIRHEQGQALAYVLALGAERRVVLNLGQPSPLLQVFDQEQYAGILPPSLQPLWPSNWRNHRSCVIERAGLLMDQGDDNLADLRAALDAFILQAYGGMRISYRVLQPDFAAAAEDGDYIGMGRYAFGDREEMVIQTRPNVTARVQTPIACGNSAGFSVSE
ncbi:MAG TPA: hypothetical protein PLV25_07690 [Opitutales bacterium]|nr:hypothetical protein [Opitutales bacterium]